MLVASVVMLAAVGFVGFSAFSKLHTGGFEDPAAESTKAAGLLESQFGGAADLVFVVDVGPAGVDAPTSSAAGANLTEALSADPDLAQVVSYWSTDAPALRSDDGRQALVVAYLVDGDAAGAVAARYSGAAGPLHVTAGGPALVGEDINAQVGRDLAVAESIAIPVILVLLVIAFGSAVAALLPLVVGTIAILGTFGELSVLGSLTDVSIYAVNLTTALGLGLGIDYALLLVSRYREELASGRSVSDSVVRTVETAGRTIVFSGLAVAAALAALLVFPLYFLRSFAYAGIGVVAIAVVGAVVTLPALLTVLGPRVNAGRLPWLRRSPTTSAPFWSRLATDVMRHPLRYAGPVVAILLLAALPLLQVTFSTPDDRVLPTSAPSRQVGDAIRDGFAGNEASAIDVVTTGPVAADAMAEFAAEFAALPGVEGVETASTPTSAHFAVITPADPRSETARELVKDIRAVTPPEGVDALVGGGTASLVDSLDAVSTRLPVAAGLIALTTFVVLFLFTGSVVQPLRALACNALTLGATLGIMVLVFQEGFASSVLGFTPSPLDMSMLVLLFCIAFGLSMDYEVFVVSRIKERLDAGASIQDATVYGLAHSGRIVTTAAALLAVSFFAFVTSEVSFLQLFGLGSGLAILIDATLVRGVLVPASMRLLGQRAWYAPTGLRRLHARIGLAET
jgi:RND superfamily putative drug exporter